VHIFNEIEPFRAFLRSLRNVGKTIGFVPTMGALHEGHLELIKQSKSENAVTVCSIFVNPAQFNNPTDLAKYPRTIEGDTSLLKSVGCDVLFLPAVSEMYPSSEALTFNLGALDNILEGEFRPGHFSGVALVVSKLFNIVHPTRAYFGQKDFQQVMVIKKLVNDLNFDLNIVVVPTVRENDGLAMSSRNLRLNPENRKKALLLYQSLQEAKALLLHGKNFSEVKKIIQSKFKSTDVRLEYFELCEAENLKSLNSVDANTKAVLLVAAYVGEVRLIDNMLIHEN
jgi:pantoate--beta-alanine ligase